MKKKLILCFATLCLGLFGFGQGIYDFSIGRLGGGAINLNSYQGKKIIIVTYDASSPNINDLYRVDSIYKADTNRVAVIAVGINDQGSLADSSLLQILQNDFDIRCKLGKPVKGNKNNPQQDILFKWLTHSSLNDHYNVNVTEGGQVFIISEQGTLYGTFRGGTSASVLMRAINRNSGQ